MKTLAQSWAERLAELRGQCRQGGQRLEAELRDYYQGVHRGEWWAEFCNAADRGDDLPLAVWNAAEELGADRCPGYVARLRVRNRAARDHLKLT